MRRRRWLIAAFAAFLLCPPLVVVMLWMFHVAGAPTTQEACAHLATLGEVAINPWASAEVCTERVEAECLRGEDNPVGRLIVANFKRCLLRTTRPLYFFQCVDRMNDGVASQLTRFP
jgi:hypothetical protein